MATKNKKRKKNRRILLLLLLLFATGTMLGTSTYAWFTANKQVSISSVKVNVAAQGGIQISADGTSWKAILQNTDITGAHAGKYTTSVNQIPSTMEPVSTNGVPDANGHLPMWYGIIASNTAGDYILTTSAAQETDTEGIVGKYVAFDVFFKYDGAIAKDVYITTGSGVSADGNDTGIKNASRFAFVNLGHTTTTAALGDIQALNSGTGSTVDIWEPNYNSHSATGALAGNETYGLGTIKTDGTQPQIPYSAIKAAITSTDGTGGTGIKVGEANAVNYSAKFDDMTAKITKSTKDTFATTGFNDVAGDYMPIFSLTPGITKYRIYMWVEGQDIDCENNASGGNIAYDLQFSLNTKVGE